MLFPILLVVIPTAILLACFAWGRSDEDDTLRKIIVSVVQVMCLLVITAGIVSLASRSANGPTASDDASIETATPATPARTISSPAPAQTTAPAPIPPHAPTPEEIAAKQRADEEFRLRMDRAVEASNAAERDRLAQESGNAPAEAPAPPEPEPTPAPSATPEAAPAEPPMTNAPPTTDPANIPNPE